jgi:hypothetical protein
VVYLDQFVYINLTRATLGRDHEELLPVREELLAARLAEQVYFPLSQVHYRETWGRGSPQSRRSLAAEMFRWSGFLTVAPVSKLLPYEIDRAVRARFSRPPPTEGPAVFGSGAAHALGYEPDSERTQMTIEQAVLFELAMLAGEGSSARVEADGAEFAQALNTVGQRLAGWRTHPEDRQRRLRVNALQEFQRDFVSALLLAGVPVEDFAALGGEGLEALVADVPTLWTLTELRRVRHANPAQSFSRTDLNDLRALAVAIVYCDVVVADRAWVNACRRTDLAATYHTNVVPTLQEAAIHVAQRWAHS